MRQAGDTLVVEALETYRGTTTFSYQACQGDDARTSTVTLVVDRLADLRAAKKPRTRGKVLVSNGNAIPVRVAYGSATTGRPDATRTVPARGSITITTARKTLYWLGLHDDAGVLVTVGDGVVQPAQTSDPPARQRPAPRAAQPPPHLVERVLARPAGLLSRACSTP